MLGFISFIILFLILNVWTYKAFRLYAMHSDELFPIKKEGVRDRLIVLKLCYIEVFLNLAMNVATYHDDILDEYTISKYGEDDNEGF